MQCFANTVSNIRNDYKESYAAKDTIFWQKRPKTIVIRIIVLDDNIQIYSYGRNKNIYLLEYFNTF
jgi:hypothetical protein